MKNRNIIDPVKNLNILIADDHKLFRKGVANLLYSMVENPMLREAGDGKELLAKIKEKEPDLVILDLELPEIDGFEAAKYIISHHPEVKILILTMYDNVGFIEYLWELGIHGYILKSAELEEMHQAVISVVRNDFFSNHTLEKAKSANNTQSQAQSSPERLTPKEKEVLDLLCHEMTNKEIGEKLELSSRTIEKIRARIMKKSNTSTTVGLVKYALKQQIFKI